jgi:rhodanese-related sulfurtransferase
MIFRRGHQILCGLLALLPLHGVLSAAGAYVSPESIDGATVINAEQLIELAGSQADLVIVDSRIREDREEGYIEGSRHLLDRDTNCASLSGLLPGKVTPVVFYCNGISCDRSDRAVVTALGCGYTSIYWFRGGIEEWREKNFPLIH